MLTGCVITSLTKIYVWVTLTDTFEEGEQLGGRHLLAKLVKERDQNRRIRSRKRFLSRRTERIKDGRLPGAPAPSPFTL